MFPAKILLFGEYSLMQGSNALAVPFRNYSGKWSRSTLDTGSASLLLEFANYLENKQNGIPFKIDIQKFKKDISLNLCFDSSIPISYGIGSSGALCAAFYETYVTNPIPANCNDNELPELKNHLSFLEKYFHGTSSGIDPLISYTNATLVLEGKGNLRRLISDQIYPDDISVFLLDTQKYGNTEINIKLFNDLLKEDYYSQEFKSNYIPLVNASITYYLEHKTNDFFESVNKLSLSQQSFFEPMIPSDFQKYFRIAHETSKFSLKLCGSGGGGFLLGFTSDIEYTNKLFSADEVKMITINLNHD